MNLVIDRGNTHLKYGVFDQRELIASHSTDFLDKNQLETILSKYGITHSVLSSVVTENNKLLKKNIQELSIFFLELEHSTSMPFTWNYKSKETIGKDRLAAIAGAISLYPQSNLLVFDAGTALTYEFINEKQEFVGGNISPGMQMRYKALNKFTSQLPLLKINPNAPILGNSTGEAIEAGVQNSMILEIDGIIELFRKQYPKLKTVITGGDAEFFARKLKNPIFVAPNLVLVGLNRILEYNAQHI